MNKEDNQLVDVIIVGGGAAGIGAAYELSSQSSLRWKVLEASPCMGGRVQKKRIDGRDIDIGAYEFAGFDEQTELISLIKQGMCKLNLREHLNRIVYMDEEEGEFAKQEIQRMEDIMEKLVQFTKQICKQQTDKVVTMYEVVELFKKTNKEFQLCEPKMKRLFNLNINMVEHEEAGDMESLPALETLTIAEGMEEDYIDIQPIPQETYADLLMNFVHKFPKQSYQCNTQVIKILKNGQNNVEVTAKIKNGSQFEVVVYHCKKVIIAVPLTVLKNGSIQFEPSLPSLYRRGLENIEPGVMQKIILAFQQPFWPADAQRIKIAGHQHGIFPHFINLSGPKNINPQEEAHILVGFMTSRPAIKMWSQLPQPQIIEKCIDFLKKVFPNKDIRLKEWYVTDWANTPFINQSFSHLGQEGTVKMTEQLRAGIDDYLWMAGEYLFGGNMGCAHGAFALGSRAAKEIIERAK